MQKYIIENNIGEILKITISDKDKSVFMRNNEKVTKNRWYKYN